ATGTNAGLYNTIIAVLTAITIVLGMRMMGTLLISSLIIFPPLISIRIFKTFKSVVICSAVVSVIGFLVGMLISFSFRTPAGASVVVFDIILLALSYFISIVKNRNKKGSVLTQES
ncbi:MAG: metal ABC transporter permease, partial [Bacillota bacterium]|nr:metal ABC transporter permease [Bacillota bacterium]